jgi:hypothetical protein
MLGGYAVAWHGHPRFTGAVDFFVDRTPENAAQVVRAIEDFGLAALGISVDDFMAEESCVYFGVPPRRVDIINFASGISFDEAWVSRIQGDVGGTPCKIIGKETLLRNKRATGRGKDLADVETLEKRWPKA